MEKVFPGGIALGTCYYPEHWPRELWRQDLERMLDSGITFIRIGEFAWSKVEPEEGRFVYDFFDAFLDLTDEMGMKVIMGTPTATPPAWLTEKYPEVLNCDVNGLPYRHGMRRHYNYNSPVYREKTAVIVGKFAARYAGHPSVAGWQIDNELNCETDLFYSEADSAAFRTWLKERYATLDALNAAWGTVFWNQTYTSFEEIYVPRKTIQNTCNPHLALDYRRFISDSALRFMRLQSDILRRYLKPGDFITTNGIFGHLDYRRALRESLDFVTYDSYPNFGYAYGKYDPREGALRDREASRTLTRVRAVSPAFGIMEQQTGANGWVSWKECPTPREGQISLWSMQSIAHGADFVSYFRWRTCPFGTEMYWHGILDYSGRDNRRLREIRGFSQRLKGLSALRGSRYLARTAVLWDLDNEWDAEADVWHGDLEKQSRDALFEAAQRTHTPMDAVCLDEETTLEDLQGYKALFYPHALVTDEKRVRLLERYCENGGILVLGCRTGLKDMNGRCTMEKLPGPWRKLTGTDIPEYGCIPPMEGVTISWRGHLLPGALFAEELEENGGQVTGRYAAGFCAGRGAVTESTRGSGRVIWWGTAFTPESARALLKECGVRAPWDGLLTLPECVEIAPRANGKDTWLILLNYSAEKQEIPLKAPMTDEETGKAPEGTLTLPPYGTAVLRLDADR